MVKARYIPDRGDLVWLNLNPARGHEQVGERPGFVISERPYNKKTGLALICPVTSQVKGYEFEVALPKNCSLQGVVLSDHVRSIDWRARRARRVAHVEEETTAQVAELISILAQGE